MENVTSYQQHVVLLFRDIALIYVAGVAIIVGIVTSVLTLFLFHRDISTSAGTRFLIMSVSWADIVFLSCGFGIWTLVGFFPIDSPAAELLKGPTVNGALFYIGNVSELFRNWLVVLIAVERFFFILKPIQFKVAWTINKVRMSTICILLVCFIVRVPTLLYAIWKSQKAKETRLLRTTFMAHNMIDCILLSVLPITGMSIFTMISTFKIKSAARYKQRLVRPTENMLVRLTKEDKLIQILQTVVIYFVIFSIPSVPATIVHFCVAYFKLYGTKIDLISDILSVLTNLGSVLNSSSNFFIYIFQSRRYRRILKDIFICN